MKNYIRYYLVVFLLLSTSFIKAQEVSAEQIKKMIQSYKKDQRGPYQAIKWYCLDGSIIGPKEKCPEPGGNQRAQYKNEVLSLWKTNKILLGQILATTPNEDFWDESNQNSRLKQYQLEKYLKGIDNGWILRRAQYYRGAIQIEDEENWGVQFYEWLLNKSDAIDSKYFLIRESLKDIPHKGDDNKSQSIRSISKIIADTLASFTDLRIKIHGQPDITDLQKVKDFKKINQRKLTSQVDSLFIKLILDMESVYTPIDLTVIRKKIEKFKTNSELKDSLLIFAEKFNKSDNSKTQLISKLKSISNLLLNIRKQLNSIDSPKNKLLMLDISLLLEEIFFREIPNWDPNTISDLLNKNYILCKAAAGCGYLELWEWRQIDDLIKPENKLKLDSDDLTLTHENTRRILEWGTGMVRAAYSDVIKLYSAFEPQSNGFFDDKIRQSILLPLGNSTAQLGLFVSKKMEFPNNVIDIKNQSSIRGLNPGYAFGILEVYEEFQDDIIFSPDKIYIFNKPPEDLKPVAGIATVSEGNLVSHVQLLARNLGIPNSVISLDNLNELKKYSGKKIFYAVSPKGTVIMKLENKMSPDENKLFDVKKRVEEEVFVPIDKLNLDQKKIINLKDLRATDSGKLCGPKAANLGQLKFLFPNRVVDGFAIPFGIFKEHMMQKIPDMQISYWDYLNQTFKNSEDMEKSKKPKDEIDKYIMSRLEELRRLIKSMSFKKEFVEDIKSSFKNILRTEIGSKAVFIRSDTNMEDLKDFTGAGLNLTVFNVMEEEKIYSGIKEVWASPYTERSYKWRQKFLKNPENVYPSILIIPSVDVDKSGVMITAGVSTGNINELTIAFSRGAGGAVEGQLSESYLVKETGTYLLLSPAREIKYTLLPSIGGVAKKLTTFEKRLLSQDNLDTLKSFAVELKNKFKSTKGIESEGPFDIELGFKDNKLWLFQVRPFVENKNAVSSEYLKSITPKKMVKKEIMLNETL